jgi:predicted Rossmann fold flavoprotein
VDKKIIVAGGGAAGYFAAITAAQKAPGAQVQLYEATAHPLAKVRVSGGGRCNVTHACFEPAELVKRYPRGSRELLGPFHRFGPLETIAWFKERGVELKAEEDGRMFPTTDRSETIAGCLEKAAADAGVRVIQRCGLRSVSWDPASRRFRIEAGGEASFEADRVLLATGGTRGSAGIAIAESLGHTIVPQVPSLFTFHIGGPLLKGLEGVSVSQVSSSVPDLRLKARGGLVVTHWGLSGPAILKLSAWGARSLHEAGYRFNLVLNWADDRSIQLIEAELERYRSVHPRKQVATLNPFGLPSRLWERLVQGAGVATSQAWANLSRQSARQLAANVGATALAVDGKSMNKEEFVTAGGVALSEIDFATMQSRLVPGLHFAGEILDVDGITGGFNFQSAWTTGWHAGQSMAKEEVDNAQEPD